MPDLTYRPLNDDDFDALHGVVSVWAVVRQLGRWPWPPEPAFTRSRCKPYESNGFVWGVCRDGQLVGSIGVTDVEIGYMFASDVHGAGVGTQAVRDAVAHAFAHYGWDALKARTWHDNPASGAVPRKCGFQHWQTAYEASFVRRVPTLTHYFRLPRAQWTA